MYRFSFTESVAGLAQEMSRQLFHTIITRGDVKAKCDCIAKGDISVKRTLPAFCWHAWFDEGKRKNYTAHPSGLIMIDVDHVETPRELFAKIEKKAKEMGLLVAHITPSTKGLRLVFPVPKGMDIVRAQGYYADALGLQVDACTKDLARLSFVVPEGYFLFVDEEGLFEGPAVAADFPAADPFRDKIDSAELLNGSAEKKFSNSLILDKKTLDQKNLESFDKEFEGIPYPILVECLEEQMGGKPAHGSRNNFIFSMAAYLRYVCNDDAEWIASILPTYGEMREKWHRTIQSACQRSQYKVMPAIVKRAIHEARLQLQQAAHNQSDAEMNLPPAMPEHLPPLIAHLIKNVPEACRPSVANGVFPSLAAHLHGVKFWLIDGTEKEATFMCVNMAPQSSGKSAVNKVTEYILADIAERDQESRQRLEDWSTKVESLGANAEKPQRPENVCMQIMVSDMTNAAFVQRMKDAGDHYLYTNLEELDLLKQLQTNGTKDVGKIICLCFDNGKYGQERVGTKSVTARVDVRWNWNASSTIQKGINFFKGRLVDGTLSRINFCTIIRDRTKPFVYGRYDEKFAEELKPYIDNLNRTQGHIECQEALQLAQHMQDTCIEEGTLADDDAYQELAFRAVTIAYLKAMVLYIAQDMTWSKEIADFAEWSLNYDLWCKMNFFGDQLTEDQSKEKITKHRGRRNLLDLLPNPFTLQDALDMRKLQGLSDDGCHRMINTWMFRGYIEPGAAQEMYIKSEAYLKKLGVRR